MLLLPHLPYWTLLLPCWVLLLNDCTLLAATASLLQPRVPPWPWGVEGPGHQLGSLPARRPPPSCQQPATSMAVGGTQGAQPGQQQGLGLEATQRGGVQAVVMAAMVVGVPSCGTLWPSLYYRAAWQPP